MPRTARIAVEDAAYHFDREYDYLVPDGMTLKAGMRVVVPFGRGRDRMGLVLALAEEAAPGKKLKTVLRAADPEPLLNEERLALLRWLKEHTFCTYFEALGVLLPVGYGMKARTGYRLLPDVDDDGEDWNDLQRQVIRFLRARRGPVSGEELCEGLGLAQGHPVLRWLEGAGLTEQVPLITRRILDQKQLMVRLTGDLPRTRLTAKQAAAAGLLEKVGFGSVKEVCYFCGVTKGVVDKLVASGAAEYYEEERYRDPYWNADRRIKTEQRRLSAVQKRAVDALQREYDKRSGETAVLFGVTGSGKTQVFLELVSRVVAQGRRAMVLVPEISLTPQTIRRFHEYCGDRVAVLHSGLSLSERLDEWKRIARGLADVVVGTRSAVFAPVENLGLIVIDEEQEHTYQSEKSPRFDAREVAKVRVKYHGGLLVLSSATPSVESFYRATKGESALVTLEERYGGAKLPDVTILDLRTQEMPALGLSQQLCEELCQNLERKEQSILLMNRRGYSTQVACMSCHRPAECPNCSIALKYHAANGRMMCHYCGYSAPLAAKCAHCGSEYIRMNGMGTQRVEEELRDRFPKARILRMDADTTLAKYSHQKLLSAFGAGEYDILVGTQMVAKGLDFPNVTLVGVLSVDQELYSDDFRSYERAFSLVTQVVGRSGRDRLPGRAFIQTYTPDNPVLMAAAVQDYRSFYSGEILNRRLHLYPPFCRIYCIGITGEDQRLTEQTGERLLQELGRRLKEEHPGLPVRLLGLAPGAVARVAGRFRYKILLKGKNNAETRGLLAGLLADAGKAAPRGVSIFIDPNFEGVF